MNISSLVFAHPIGSSKKQMDWQMTSDSLEQGELSPDLVKKEIVRETGDLKDKALDPKSSMSKKRQSIRSE